MKYFRKSQFDPIFTSQTGHVILQLKNLLVVHPGKSERP
jgi:hypothetical protein